MSILMKWLFGSIIRSVSFVTVPLALTTHQDHQRGNAVSNGDTTPPPSFRVCRLALILPYL